MSNMDKFSETLDKMSFKNSFYLIGQGTPNMRYFDADQKKKLADIFCKSGGDIVYTRHLYYTNFTHYGCDVQYFNIVKLSFTTIFNLLLLLF